MTHAPRRPRRSTAALAACSLGLILGGGVGPALAAGGDPLTISHDSFDSPDGLSYVASAAPVDGVARLTPARGNQAGAVWSTSTVDTRHDISTDFTVRLHDSSSCRADGLDFVLQGSEAGNGAIGDFGGAMGYAGVEPSFAVELDDYTGNYGDPQNQHVGLLSGGTTDNSSFPADWTSTAVPPLYGDPLHVWLDYTAATGSMQVYLSADATRPEEPTIDTTVDLAALVPGTRAWAGFTAGTGACNQVQDVLDWHLTGTEGAVSNTALRLTSAPDRPSRVSTPTFTAAVSRTDGGATPSAGSVVFNVDGADQDTVPLGSSGTATFTPSYALDQGQHRITARYSGTDTDDPSANVARYEVLSNDSRIRVLRGAADGSGSVQPYGVPVIVAVGPRSPRAQAPQGTVTVLDGSAGYQVVASGPLVNGKFKLPVEALGVGNHPVYAYFVPTTSGTYAVVESLVSITKQRSTTTLSSATTRGGTVLSATVRSEVRGPKPTGTVTFSSDEGVIGTAPVRSGVAKLATRLPAGSHSVMATYGGNDVVERSDAPAITVSGGA